MRDGKEASIPPNSDQYYHGAQVDMKDPMHMTKRYIYQVYSDGCSLITEDALPPGIKTHQDPLSCRKARGLQRSTNGARKDTKILPTMQRCKFLIAKYLVHSAIYSTRPAGKYQLSKAGTGAEVWAKRGDLMICTYCRINHTRSRLRIHHLPYGHIPHIPVTNPMPFTMEHCLVELDNFLFLFLLTLVAMIFLFPLSHGHLPRTRTWRILSHHEPVFEWIYITSFCDVPLWTLWLFCNTFSGLPRGTRHSLDLGRIA